MPSAWIESVITFLEANFHCFSRIQGAENIETCPEPLQTFPNVIPGCQQSFRTVRNTPMGVDRQNPPHLDFRQNRPAGTTHDHQRSTCSIGTRNSAVVHSQIGRGTTLCANLESMAVSTRSIQSTGDRRFRDFAGRRTEETDSMLIGILYGVLGGDGRCGRDRGSDVSRKKRPGGAIKSINITP